MIEAILQHASLPDGTPYISMTYGPIRRHNGLRYQFIIDLAALNALPQDRGIYFFLSHENTRLQKIGMANGQGGLRQRIGKYRVRVNPEHPPTDLTPLFWYRVMTGNVQNNEQPMPENYGRIDLYFKSFTQLQQAIIEPFVNGLGINHVDYDPHAVLENMFIEYTVALRGNNNNGNVLFQADEQHPLLLDSNNRIPINQFAPVL